MTIMVNDVKSHLVEVSFNMSATSSEKLTSFKRWENLCKRCQTRNVMKGNIQTHSELSLRMS